MTALNTNRHIWTRCWQPITSMCLLACASPPARKRLCTHSQGPVGTAAEAVTCQSRACDRWSGVLLMTVVSTMWGRICFNWRHQSHATEVPLKHSVALIAFRTPPLGDRPSFPPTPSPETVQTWSCAAVRPSFLGWRQFYHSSAHEK